jgi:hypothetical protein
MKWVMVALLKGSILLAGGAQMEAPVAKAYGVHDSQRECREELAEFRRERAGYYYWSDCVKIEERRP